AGGFNGGGCCCYSSFCRGWCGLRGWQLWPIFSIEIGMPRSRSRNRAARQWSRPMCGIAGAVSSQPLDPESLVRMRDRMIHRGPDHGGFWLSADQCVGLVHRRLAIVDLTPEANQPFVSHDGGFIITFNGEIYNFRELRQELLARGATIQT